MNQAYFDIAVIGGGVIGATTALSLYKQGYNVVVLEKNTQFTQEASQAGGGIISPLHPWRYSKAMLDLAAWSHEKFPELVHQLSCLSGVDIPLIKTGMLVPNIKEAEAALKCSFLSAKVLSSQDVFSIEPGISEPKESVFVEEVKNIRNPALCKALPIAMIKLGISQRLNFYVESIKKQKNGFQVSSKNDSINANKVIVCSGAWSSQMLSLCDDLFMQNMPNIFPVKGQMIAIKAKLGVLRTVILDQNRYLIPRHDGIVVVGSTIEKTNFEKDVTKAAFQELREFAYKMLPALKHYPIISQWAGLRPGSRRDKPYICEVEKIEGLYLNTGHFRNGLLSAPASAQVLTDIITGQTSQFNLNSYAI